MRRATSLLLALAMLVCMLPGAALPTAAAPNGQLYAYYTNTDITVDGKLDETGWLLDQSVGSTPIAMQCSYTALYVGLQTRADKAAMTINGVSVVANVSTGSVTVGGDSAGSVAYNATNGTMEIQIPLENLNLVYDKAQEVSFSLEVGSDRYTGTALLAEKTMIFFENCLDADKKADIAKHLSSSVAEQYAVATENGIHYQTGTLTKDGIGISVPAYTISRVAPTFDIYKGWEMSFNVDFNDLAIPAEVGPIDRFALTGFFLDMRASKRCHHGFYADEAGNIYVTQYEQSAADVLRYDTGLDLPAKDVDVRIVVNDAFESEVFINGKSVGKFNTSKRVVSGDNTMYFNVATRYRENDKRGNDVVLRDIFLTQTAPSMPLTAYRLPREGVLTQDGNVSETCWALIEAVPGVRLGALVDTENLYLALNTQTNSVKFSLGEYTINADLGKNPKVAVGFTMGSTIKGDGTGGYEITIPLSLLKLEKSLGETFLFTVSSGSSAKTFNLGLGTATLSLAEYVPATDDGLRNATAYLNTDTLNLDGALKENQWHIAHEAAGPANAPAADFGFLWDGKYMYIGGQVFSASQADKLELTMGGKTFSADLAAATATLGDIAVQGQTFEWRVPLADVGVQSGINMEKEFKFTTTAEGNTSFMQGKILFAAKSMVIGDACRDFNSREYTVITASSVKYTEWAQDNGHYFARTNTEALGTNNEIHQHFTTLLNYDGSGDYEFEVDLTILDLPNIETTIGWRGLCWELREPEFQTRFNFRSDGKGQVIMDYLGNRGPSSIPTGVQLGERAVFTVKVSDKLIASVYVDGEYVGTFPPLDRTKFDIKDNYHMPRLIMQIGNHTRALNADGTLGAVNVQIHDIKMVQNIYDDVPGMLEKTMLALTADSVLTGNDPDPDNATALRLPTELTGYGLPCRVKWTAVDRSTGEIANYVNLETGIVTPGNKPVSFNLIADVNYEGVSASKTFVFSTQGNRSTGNVSLITNDTNPLVGQATDWERNEFTYFDTTRNSLVLDQGSSKQFNTITLRDLDEVSRVSQQHLGVFVSDDGKTFTKVTGWLLHQDGSEYTIYNLNAKARYVKVHTYHDALGREGEQPSFYNSIRDMISVSNDPNLPGAGGTFAHKADYAVTASGKDVPVFISLADLGAKAGQYKNGCADFRFTVGNTTLAHWFNGSDGFYVRVPSAPATVTAHWGCASAKDFSNAENVFEASYGNVALFDLTDGTDFSSHGRPWTMSNGDIIVVGRYNFGGNDGTLGLVRSTDGGRTFTKSAYPIAKNIKGWSQGFGGFLYDDQLDRLYAIGYLGSVADSNDYRLFFTYTEDCGYTWSELTCLSNPLKEPVKDNDIFVSNMPEDIHRAILYSEGLALKDRDGDGPNVDYVIVYNDTHQKTKVNCMVSVFSKDGGKTWQAGEGEISMPQVDATKEIEDGISEHSFTQLSDGSLHVYCRAQHVGNYYFYEGISYDYGNTWTSDFSKVIASNTSPVAMEYNKDRILLWSSYNSVGQKSYLRAPMHVGYTTDEYKSFEKVIDLTFGTTYDGLEEQYYHFTQPGICFTPDGKDAVVTFWDASTLRRHTQNTRATIGFLVEEFDRMLYDNKGGYEDFETASLKYEGWVKHTGDSVELTREQSASGLWSMKLDGAATSYITRQIPSMKAGTVGARVKIPAGNAKDVFMTLKAGYNFNGLQHALASVAISPDGTISAAYYDGTKTPLAKVNPGSWADVAVSFDIASKMGRLTVNGKVVGDIKLTTSAPLYDEMVEDVVREITAVQFMQPDGNTNNRASFLYVDDFYCTELTSAIKRSSDAGFADVKENDWFCEAINFAVDNGIMSGYSTTKFGPNDTLTRAMVVQVLYNKEGTPDLNGAKHSFKDVPTSQWFNNAVTWGSNRGVVSGFGGGVFKPEDAVTIEQVAVILWNYSFTPGGAGDLSKVGSHSDWAANALRWAEGKGILNGLPFTNATEKATRAQAAQMLTNYLRTN
ncbi:MAG: S-layer homology domain-containing protein [Oscillospiraceae bacterium]|nr:S-layer homology domain-containing protein [Oscillospiraceae bacterium]